MKIFMAGTYSHKYVVEEHKNDYILESFYSIKEWQIPYIKECKMFLLDSGAFTFMNSNKGKTDFNQYLKDYINFINKYDIKYFFELDIDSIVGHEKVKEMRAVLEKGTGKKCIPVWHKSRGLEEWRKLTKEYDYVAIGGIVTKEIKRKEYKYFSPMLSIAKENGCKVHGLVHVVAPLVELNKTGVVKLGLELGTPYDLTWSCYEGGEKQCGKCGTCIDRKKAFEANGVKDPVEYEE